MKLEHGAEGTYRTSFFFVLVEATALVEPPLLILQ